MLVGVCCVLLYCVAACFVVLVCCAVLVERSLSIFYRFECISLAFQSVSTLLWLVEGLHTPEYM